MVTRKINVGGVSRGGKRTNRVPNRVDICVGICHQIAWMEGGCRAIEFLVGPAGNGARIDSNLH